MSLADEQHYSPKELAALWGLSAEMIRRMFADEPGVLKIGPRLRVPGSVVDATLERLTTPGTPDPFETTEPVKPYFGCVYCVTHRRSGRVYVGRTENDPLIRWSAHVRRAKCDSVYSSRFHEAIRKFGVAAFDLKVLDYASDHADLKAREMFWIRSLDATNPRKGYNVVAYRCHEVSVA